MYDLQHKVQSGQVKAVINGIDSSFTLMITSTEAK